jgi:hypothetical protein
MASLAKIVVPVLLMGKFMRTLDLWSFRAPAMSPRGKIHGFLTRPLVLFLSPSVGTQTLFDDWLVLLLGA